MESHRHGASGSSPDSSRTQQGYNLQQPRPGPRGSPRPHSDSSSSSKFGVRIQIQGIEGLPYVVLNNGDSRAVLPSGGLESYSRNWDHQEVSVYAHSQSEYTFMVNDRQSPFDSPNVERSSLGSPNVERRLPNHQREYARGGALTEVRESQRTPLASAAFVFDFQESQRTVPTSNTVLNFQRHPELLKPYNPDRNSLSPLLLSTRRLSVPSTQTASVPRPGHLTRGLESGAGATLIQAAGSRPGAARIPLPAGGVERAPTPVSATSQTQCPGPAPAPVSSPTQTQCPGPAPVSAQTQCPGPAPVSAPALHHSSLATLLSPPNEITNIPRRSPNSVDTEPISSVGSLINQFDSPQQMGRAGPRRGRIAPEDRRRSRSVDSRQQRHSYPLDPSSPASAIRGARGETLGGATSAPGSPKVRGANGPSTVMFNKLQWEEKEPTSRSSRAVNVLYRVEKTSMTRSRSLNQTEESARDIQIITPDLLEGQRDLLEGQRGQHEVSIEPQPNEDSTKKILFTYLNDGTTDMTSITEKKVNLVFDRINQLKWKTAENVEEEIRDYAAKAKEAKELQRRGAELEREVSQLKTQLERKTMSGRSLAEVCYKAQTDMKTIQEELDRRQEELSTLRDRLAQMEAELEVAIEELVQVKTEREQGRTEMKDLQQQLSEMHDELDQAKNTTQADSTEKQLLLKDLAQLRLDFQELIQVQEEQEEVLHWRERELTALKGALKEEVESHDKELGIMKEVRDKEVQKLREEVEEVKESNTVLGQEKREMEEERGEARGQVNQLNQELRGQVEELDSRVEQLNLVIKDSKTLQRQLVKCIEQLKREKRQVEETLAEVREKEEEMSQANKALLVRLENVQSEMTQLNHQHREVKERLKEERSRVEELKRIKSDLEEERRLQNSTVEELQKEMSTIVEGCEVSTEKLQLQVDEVRKKSHSALSELQQQLQEKGVELEKSRQTTTKLQEELLPLEQGLERVRREWEEAQQRGRQLERTVEELEERNAHAHEDHARQVKLMKGEVGHLEHVLSEERNSADLLMDRVDQGKQQASTHTHTQTHTQGPPPPVADSQAYHVDWVIESC
uniref:Myosin tail domain-containing protein n=1 Tax=Hucho hucho TaxID=62062 RepID=A0A4W5PF32_9TELE